MVVVDEEQFRTLPASIATARAYHAQALGDVPGTVKYARRALDLLPEDDYLRARHRRLRSWGSPTGRAETWRQPTGPWPMAWRICAEAGNILFAISGTYGLADIRMAQGRLHEAVKYYEQSLQLAAEQGEPVLRGTADLYLGLSELYREQGDLEAATTAPAEKRGTGRASCATDWPYRLALLRRE